MVDFQIYTYGGGKILQGIFNAIAMLSNGNASLYQTFITIGLCFGFFWAITQAFFKGSIETFYGRFFIPVLIMATALLIPKATVYINDPTEIGNSPGSVKFAKVDKVPFVLAFFSQFISSIGHKTTKAIETVMHVPNDLSYNNTGNIFGAETILDSKKYIITNEDLSKNLRTFVQKCIIPDLQLGRYKMDELYKSKDLYSFLEANTSKVLAMDYQSIGSSEYKQIQTKEHLTSTDQPTSTKTKYAEDRKLKNKAQIRSCYESLQILKPHLKGITDYYLKNYLKSKTSGFRALTNLNVKSEDLIEQQLLINAINNTDNPIFTFAKHRAYRQQKNTYQLVGALAGKSLVVLRNVFESLIYCSFLLIIPLLLFPGGWKILGTWVQMVLWIQLWPPFYAILNYVMQIIAQGKASKIFNGLGEDHIGLSIFTSLGLENLNSDMFALAGYLSASIPFISYALIKGGVSSFVHLATSMMTPVHSSSGSAAIEKVTGNYSYGNISYGNLNYGNSSMLQKNYAPSYSGGYATDASGTAVTSYGDLGHVVMNQKTSNLRSGISFDKAIQSSLQKTGQQLNAEVETTQNQHLESVQEVARASSSLISHQANNINSSHSYVSGMDESVQEAYRNIIGTAKELGKTHNMNDSTAIDTVINAGINAKFLGIGGSVKSMTSVGDGYSDIEKATSADDFQKNLQTVLRYAENNSMVTSDDIGNRLTNDLSASKDRLKMTQEAKINAYQKMQQFSESQSEILSNSGRISENYNQDFIKYGIEKYGNTPVLETILNKPNDDESKKELYESFQNEYIEPRINKLVLNKNSLKDSFNENSSEKRSSIANPDVANYKNINRTINEKEKSFKSNNDLLIEQQNFKSKKANEISNIASQKTNIKKQEADLLNHYNSKVKSSITEKTHKEKNKLIDKTKKLFGDN